MYQYNFAPDNMPGGPREKLQAQGIDLLSNAELLALIINVGNRRESVLEMSQRIIKDYGVSALSGVKDYRKLLTQLELPQFKAMQIVAVLELGRRLYLENKGKRALLNSAHRVFQKFSFLGRREREELRALYLNSRQLLIGSELIAIGNINAVTAQQRDIISAALEYYASGVIIVHNHPSGEVTPSAADIDFTKQLQKGCRLLQVNLLDHVIIGKNTYFSFTEGGLMT